MHIILLPGLDGSGLFFEAFRKLLPSSVSSQIISYPRDECLTYGETVDHIYEQLPRDRDYVLLAESFSGPVAIDIAALAPLKLKGLILVSTFCFSPLTPLKTLIADRLLFLLNFSAPPRFINWLLCNDMELNLSERVARVVDALPTETLKSRVQSALQVDLRGALDDVEVPIMLLKASEDRLLDPSSSHTIKKYYDSAELFEVEGPHFLLQCNPEECLRAIENFLEALQMPTLHPRYF